MSDGRSVPVPASIICLTSRDNIAAFGGNPDNITLFSGKLHSVHKKGCSVERLAFLMSGNSELCVRYHHPQNDGKRC